MAWTNAGRRKAAAERRGKHLKSSTRKKISAKLKGRKRSSATKKRISASLKGRKHAHKGHKLSSAAKAKISAKLKGRKVAHHKSSSTTRAKIRAALLGKKHPHKGHKGPHKKRISTHHTAKRKISRKTRSARRIHGRTNQQIIQRLSRHRVTSPKRRQSNALILQKRLGRRLMPVQKSMTNKRLVLNALHRRRRV